MTSIVNLKAAFDSIEAPWQPHIAARVNDCEVRLAKLEGEFIWHAHEGEDELFLVIKGTLRMRLRDGERTVREGEMILIPRGVEHCPVADEEVHVLLFEPASTVNTGGEKSERTLRNLARIGPRTSDS